MHQDEPDPMPEDELEWSTGVDDELDWSVVDEEQLENAALNAYLEAEDEYVPLPSEDSFLILSGDDAGSVVTAPPTGSVVSKTGNAPPRIDRDQALTGSRPIYLVQRGGRYYKFLPRVLVGLHASYGDSLALGAIVNIPSANAQANRNFFSLSPVSALRIADPQCYLLDTEVLRLPKVPIKTRGYKNAPYLADVEASDWVQRVLDSQRASGANLLLTPGRALDPDDPQRSLDKAYEQGDDVLSRLGHGERVALNLTLPARWLSSTALRNRLLDQIMDQDQFDTLYVRVQWAQGKAFTPPDDAELLTGIKKLANLCADEERSLLLPQTGLTGWYALAHGAAGFGLGVSGTDQAFAEYVFRAGAKGAVERYFEKQLIHTLERNTHEVLARTPGYVRCTCPYCPALFANEPWSHELSALHYLHIMGELTARVQRDSMRNGRHAALRRLVDAAQRFATDLPLSAEQSPKHLDAWGRAL
ncbi:hypothetical protein QFZ22_005353 [Streptomyces canus]|uniref:C2H2-type domain-containing protein n=1 Tax=Streptomyces canus TaxID=58343 RepID=A0AAW8FKN0_9ACTN|nr:hypothetical protein [Streptomyces canus]MDQ0909368.1 hypothetical protein [Streptomyces canus]